MLLQSLFFALFGYTDAAKARLYWKTSEIHIAVDEEKTVEILCDVGMPGDYTLRMGADWNEGDAAEIVKVEKTYLTGSRAETPVNLGSGWWRLKAGYGMELLWCVGPHWEVTIKGLRPGTYRINSDWYATQGANDILLVKVETGPTPPTAHSNSASTACDRAVTIALQATDDGLPNPPGRLSYVISSLPLYGTLKDPAGGTIATPNTRLSGYGNQVIYTPSPNYTGTDTFKFKADDGGTPPNGGLSNEATVTITIWILGFGYYADMDTNPGWTGWTFDAGVGSSKWEWGTPRGLGGEYENPDPTSAYTGANVIGYNLSGDYRNNISQTEWATTPPINCSGIKNVHLKFYRWLNVQESDRALIEISVGGPWNPVWQNGTNRVADRQWVPQDYAIPQADGQGQVRIRWGMGPTDSSWRFSGWNIDDVNVVGQQIEPPPKIQVTPAGLDFGSVVLGTYKDLDFTVENIGGGTLAGNASLTAPFSIVSGSSYSLTKNQKQIVRVRFAPTGPNDFVRTVTFTGGGGTTREVKGTVAPKIGVKPSSRNLGQIMVGSDANEAFTVENIGGGTLLGTASTTAPFSIVSGGSYSIRTGQTHPVVVRFSPTKVGHYEGSVTFTGGGGASSKVEGTGMPVPPILYVDDDAPQGGDGSSWENALINLQDALRLAVISVGTEKEVREVRVAAGIQKPDRGTGLQHGNRSATFQLINGLVIKGGYGGIDEPDPNARDIEFYRTVLTGDLTGNDADIKEPGDLPNEPSRAENSFHVVNSSGTNQTAVLDGFIITGGYAHSDREVVGGGMIVEAGTPQVVSCSFTGNFAQLGGGAMCNSGTNLNRFNPTLANCTFSRNYAGNTGGGILNNSSSPITLYNCTFVRNSAGQYGGAMSDLEAGSRLTKCRFSWNSAINGGAMHITLGDTSFTNCILIGNWAEYGAGIFVADTSHVTIMNCTFAGNLAFKGNTMACNGFASGQPASSALKFANCILWDGGNEIWKNGNSVISVSYSNVQGAWPGQSNFNVDPLFADPNDGDYHLKSEAGRWDAVMQIWIKDQVTSRCIDAGNPSTPVGDELSPNGGRVNVGAYGGTAEASKSD